MEIKFGILVEKIPDLDMAYPTQPEHQKIYLTLPGSKGCLRGLIKTFFSFYVQYLVEMVTDPTRLDPDILLTRI